jgi:hypothetical protein
MSGIVSDSEAITRLQVSESMPCKVQSAMCFVIVTLAMMEVLRGLAFITSNGDAVMISGALARVLIMDSVQDAIGLLNVPTF